MTPEEKVKAYDKIVNKLRHFIKQGITPCLTKVDVQDFFPELKESEDERIRKELLEHCKNQAKPYIYTGNKCYQIQSWIDWLEKHGKEEYALKSFKDEDVLKFMQYIEKEAKAYEFNLPNRGYDIYAFAKDILCWIEKQCKHKSNKIAPKFKVGDWAVSNLDKKVRQISEVHFDEYNSYYVVGGQSVNLEEYDRLHHLWSIEDAKNGDVLFYDSTCGFTFIYVGINSKGALLYSYVESNDGSPLLKYNIGKPNVGIGYAIDKNIYPATKEQRELLFQKMHEAGYEWDAEKKELKKIEQNPSWSEEDENVGKKIIKFLKEQNYFDGKANEFKKPYKKEYEWLKSLKERYVWKPSNEQMNALDSTLQYNQVSHNSFKYLNSLFNDLKKLRED